MRMGWLDRLHPLARRTSVGVMDKALTGYYVMTDPKTPRRAKIVLLGALAYLVLPTDLIPDFIPAVGFTDDAGAIALAMLRVAASVRPRHREQAKSRLRDWGLLPHSS